MKPATLLQLALVAIVGGLLFMIAGVAQQNTAPPPAPAYPIRQATAEDERQWQLDRLAEELNRITASPMPPVPLFEPAVPHR